MSGRRTSGGGRRRDPGRLGRGLLSRGRRDGLGRRIGCGRRVVRRGGSLLDRCGRRISCRRVVGRGRRIIGRRIGSGWVRGGRQIVCRSGGHLDRRGIRVGGRRIVGRRVVRLGRRIVRRRGIRICGRRIGGRRIVGAAVSPLLPDAGNHGGGLNDRAADTAGAGSGAAVLGLRRGDIAVPDHLAFAGIDMLAGQGAGEQERERQQEKSQLFHGDNRKAPRRGELSLPFQFIVSPHYTGSAGERQGFSGRRAGLRGDFGRDILGKVKKNPGRPPRGRVRARRKPGPLKGREA